MDDLQNVVEDGESLFTLNCAQCGGDHDITYTRMAEPVEIDGKKYYFRGVCKKTDKPVYGYVNNRWFPD